MAQTLDNTVWVQVINKNIKRHTTHITGSYILESGVRQPQSLYAQWPVKSVHDHDDGGSARSEFKEYRYKYVMETEHYGHEFCLVSGVFCQPTNRLVTSVLVRFWIADAIFLHVLFWIKTCKNNSVIKLGLSAYIRLYNTNKILKSAPLH